MGKWITTMMLLALFTLNTLAQKCSSPTNLQAGSITDNSAVLSWDGSPDNLTFSVDVMHSGGTTAFKWSTTTSETSVMVDGLEAGSEYRFKVQANCDKGKGNTNWVTFTTTGEKVTGPGPCPKATNLAVRDVTDSTVVLTWLPSAQHVDFQVDVKSKNQTTSYNFSQLTTDTFVNVEGLEPGGNYHFRVKASCEKNSAGSSDWIDFSTTGGDSTFNQCPKPKNLSVLEVTDSSALLSWIIQDSAKSFKVDVKSGSQTAYYSKTINTPDTFYIALGLEPLGNYKFRVVATCMDGSTSGSSDWSNFRTLGLRDTTVVDSTGNPDSTRVVDSLTVQSTQVTAQVINKPDKSQRGKENRKNSSAELVHITFYPNPADNQLSVQLPENQTKHMVIIQLSNLEGRPVLIRQIKDPIGDVLLNVSNLKEGLYQLTVRSGAYLDSQKIFISHQ